MGLHNDLSVFPMLELYLGSGVLLKVRCLLNLSKYKLQPSHKTSKLFWIFLRLYRGTQSAKIHLSQKVLFYLSKSFFCAQHINAWKWHLIKKIRTTSFFLCAIAFSSAKIQLSQKVLFYLSKLCFCAQRINAWKWHLIKKSGPHLFSVSLCVFKCKDSSLFITGRLYRSPWFLLMFVFP